ncbi:MAG: glycosyltransferase family 9 protein [Deltaproteobacteria bacterium]|nr:glycosyltransferase family 9 protein [Deltaproteobacteria bacterium]
MKILVIQLRQLGDILLTTPCLRALKEDAVASGAPEPEIVFLSHPMGRLVLRDNPYIDELVTYPTDRAWWAEWALARALRTRRFDLVFDFMNNPRSAFYARMTGAPQRLAFTSARRPAYTLTVPKPADAGYIVREKFALLRAAGLSPRDEHLVFTWAPEDALVFHEFLAAQPAVAGAPLRVVLSATHRREARRWPLASYAALADLLVREWGAAVLWLHGPGEEAVVDEVMTMAKEQTFKMPPTSFRGMAAFLAQCDLFVGNSNGPSHVAVAVEVPSLQLHGHTRAASWCPLTERHRAIQSPEFGKVPMPAMASITVDAVWEALRGMLPLVREVHAERQKPF